MKDLSQHQEVEATMMVHVRSLSSHDIQSSVPLIIQKSPDDLLAVDSVSINLFNVKVMAVI